MSVFAIVSKGVLIFDLYLLCVVNMTWEPGGGLGEVGEGVLGAVGQEEGWGRWGKGSRDL